MLEETEHAFAVYDAYPVNPGHILVIPKRHVANYFDLSWNEQADCWQLLNRIQELLKNDYGYEAFNVGINVGETAGQTISHAHIHLILRVTGDVQNPRGGVRGVVPEEKEY